MSERCVAPHPTEAAAGRCGGNKSHMTMDDLLCSADLSSEQLWANDGGWARSDSFVTNTSFNIVCDGYFA